jgi:hypothetical protein
MKRIALASIALVAFPFAASAQILPAPGYAAYGEFDGGVTLLQSVQTKTYTGTSDGFTYSGLKAKGDYNPAFTVGGEVGVDGLGDGNFRAGISYDYLYATLHRATVSGLINGTPVNGTFSRDALKAAGLNFDNSANVVEGQFSYSLLPIGVNVRPYIGAGAGIAIIQNNQVFAASATAGLRYAIAPEMYLGLRYRFHYIGGPKDSLGIQYNPIWTHTISAVIGLYFP